MRLWCSSAKKGSGANRDQEFLRPWLLADKPKHFFIVHQRLLPITAGHKQNIEGPHVRDAHIWGKPKPLHVANRRKFFPHDLNRCIGHA